MMDQIFEILEKFEASGLKVSLLNRGIALTKNQFCKSILLDGQRHLLCDWEAVKELYEEGYTVRVADLNKSMKAALRNSFAIASRIDQTWNLYLTRAGGRGLAPHFDPHDVAAHQLVGSKLWKIEKLVSPHFTQNYNRFVRREDIFSAKFEYSDVELTHIDAGSSLQVRTGDKHEVEAVSSSAHITVHTHIPTVNDFISCAIAGWLSNYTQTGDIDEYLEEKYLEAVVLDEVVRYCRKPTQERCAAVDIALRNEPRVSDLLILVTRAQSLLHFSCLGREFFSNEPVVAAAIGEFIEKLQKAQ